MEHTITLSDEELEELDGLLTHEVDDSRTELRRTRNRQFREMIRHRIALARDLLAKVREAHVTV